jgi:two-component system sensor histidine kinase/response regulator
LEGISRIHQKVLQSALPLITKHTPREDRNRVRILLAEHSPVNQTVAVRLLEKRGYTVVVAGNGCAALAALEQNIF